MGNLPSIISSRFLMPPPCKVMLMGLDAAGKTTILYNFSTTKVATAMPTIGFNVETLKIQGVAITAWDVGGRDKIRPLWRHYYKGTDAVVFVVDSNDHERMDQARHELQILRNEPELRGLPVLLFCNKQDLLTNGAKSANEISEMFCGIFSTGDQWRAVGCIATTGKGLHEGFAWLKGAVLEKKANAAVEAKNAIDAAPPPPSENGDFRTSAKLPSAKEKLGYDPEEGNLTLQRFTAIKRGSNCPFSKSSKLWGGPIISDNSSLEEQAKAIVAPLADFVRRSNMGQNLDGFCIELDHPLAREGGPKELGECLRQMLTTLSDLDPAKEFMMRVNFIGKRGWRFRFGGADFFVTSFAPCYPSTSSRYSFGTPHAFVLLQPEASFARHNLPFDTAVTNWEEPRTVRDKTRVAFKSAGRAYHIPSTTMYPPAEHTVKPLKDDGTSVVGWWYGNESNQKKLRH